MTDSSSVSYHIQAGLESWCVTVGGRWGQETYRELTPLAFFLAERPDIPFMSLFMCAVFRAEVGYSRIHLRSKDGVAV